MDDATATNAPDQAAHQPTRRPTPDVRPSLSGLTNRSILRVVTIALLPVVALAFIWYGRLAFFLLFSAVLFAALLDVGVRGLGLIAPLSRLVRTVIVITIFVVLLGIALYLGGATIIAQWDALIDALRQQAMDLVEFMSSARATGGSAVTPSHDQSLMQLLQRLGGFLGIDDGGSTLSAASVGLGWMANVFIILFMGFFLVAAPTTYRDGLVRFAPHDRRETVRDALDEAGNTLRNWFIGKLASMATILVLTGIGLWLADFPFALTLALLAALLAFVPNLGPLLFYIPLVLVGLSASLSVLIWGLVAYGVAQFVESYLVTPIVQNRMVSLAPALIFFAQVLMGLIFGVWGVALSTPLLAVAVCMLDHFRDRDEGR